MRGDHRNAVGDRRLDDVGQVVLALGVVAAQAASQRFRSRVGAAIAPVADLADRAIGRAGVPAFDDRWMRPP